MRGCTLKYLFLDTATTNLVVAIVIDNEIRYLKQEICKQSMSEKLMPIIDEAFKSTNIQIDELDKIFVTNGPGSFTGIRIGLTFAKTLAWTLNIPVVPISSLEVMASKKASMALIDARRGYVFAGGYNDDLKAIYDDKYIKLDEINTDLPFVSYDELDVDTCIPEIDVLKIIKKHENEKGVNSHSLNPIYLKQTEAEEKLND